MTRLLPIVLLGVLALALGCGDKQNPAGDFGSGGEGTTGDVSYSRTIAPMMAASCTLSYCHDSRSRVAGVALEAYDDVKANAESSNRTIQEGTMPTGSAPPLTPAERQAFADWVEAGAPNN